MKIIKKVNKLFVALKIYFNGLPYSQQKIKQVAGFINRSII